MQQVILLCGVGTAVESARQKTYCRLEKELAEKLGVPCFTAFTSPFIRKKLAASGVAVPSPEEELDRLTAAGYAVFLRPLTLFDGEEYRKLLALSENAAVPVSGPLFSAAGKTIIQNLCAEYPPQQNRQILLVLHGSTVPLPMDELNSLLRKAGREDILPLVLNDPLPTLPPGTGEVLLLPMMLTAGHHAARDIAGSLEPQLRAMGHAVTTIQQGIAERQWFTDLLADLIRAELQ